MKKLFFLILLLNVFWCHSQIITKKDKTAGTIRVTTQLVAPDIEAPSTPLNLVASNPQSTSIDLSWTASTDNIGVVNYHLYVNGVFATNTGNVTSYTRTGLSTNTSYTFTLKAVDASGNESAFSNSATLSTTDGGFTVTTQSEVTTFESTHGSLSTNDRYAHDYLVSKLKFENIWNKITDISTCLDGNYYKLKNSVARNNISGGNTGVNLNAFSVNNISVTLDYNSDINASGEMINVGGQNQLRWLVNGNSYVAMQANGSDMKLAHDITINTQRTFVLNSGASEMFVATKSGYLKKKDNTSNTGTFASEILNIRDVSKLNFFAVGTSLTISEANILAETVREFNSLMSRTYYDREVPNYEFIGNSITFGYEPPGFKINENYPKRVSINELGNNNNTANTSNLGVSGIRLSEVLNDLLGDDYNGVLTRNPNVDTYVSVFLGTNDFLKDPVTAADVKSDLDELTSLLIARGYKVLVILPHRSTTYTQDNPANYNSQVPTFISLVEADANYSNGTNAHDTLVFETGNASQDDTTNSTYWYDGLHPKAAYFQLMSPIIANALNNLDTGAPADNEAPTNPSNLTSSNITQTTVDLSWTASTDNVGVIEYCIFNSGVQIADTNSSNTTYQLTGLTANTGYALTIRAYDAAGNVSGDSNTINITTASIPSGSGYTLSSAKRISAGVYDANGNLLRTLVSNEAKSAGTHSAPNWDGLDEYGNNVSGQADHIKVVANNISATWEGVIGNTSDSFTGPTVHRHFLPFHDIMVHNGDIYLTKDYTEAWGSVSKASLSTPNSRIDIMPNITVQQTTNRIATDGVRLYMAGLKSFEDNISYVQAATFANLGNFNNYESFQGQTVQIFATTFKATDIVDDPASGRVTGLAVQQSGNWLIVAREGLNSVHVVHKTTGVLQQTLTYTNPKLCVIDGDDDVWMVVDGVVREYSINASTGALTATGTMIDNFNDIQGLTINSDSSLMAVADIDGNGDHRVFEYSMSNQTLVATLGRTENYAENATVYNDKFLFKSKFEPDDVYIGLAYEDDNSLWVADKGNDRILKFSSAKIYQDQVMFMPAVYRTSVDPNDITRVFAAHREFEVDYSVPLQAGSNNSAWTYKANWLEGLTSSGGNSSIKDVTTLSNGRTYGMLTKQSTFEFVELVDGGVARETGVEVTRWSFGSLKPDGTYHRVNGTGGSGSTQQLLYRQITGFDGNNNPILGAEIEWESYVVQNNLRLAGAFGETGEITDSGVYIIFYSNGGTDFHLGGIRQGDTEMMFEASKGITYNAGDPFPPNGEFDNRPNVQYRGNLALTLDNFIIWGYNGEFWEGGQTNKYNMFTDDGLFLYQYGEDSQNGNLGNAVAGMAGNAFSQKIVKYGNDIIMWHNDESYHAGLHKWVITNLDSVEEFIINIP